MALPPVNVPGVKELTTLTGDERLTIIGPGGIEQVVSLITLANFIGGGGMVTTVPNGGTGLSTITLNGVMYGNGINPVGVTAAGTTGQFLGATTGGPPTWQTPPGSVFPPTPAPDFATALQAAFDIDDGNGFFGAVLNWVYGDVTLNAPLVITMSKPYYEGVGLMMNGAKIICGFNNVAQDMLTFQATGGSQQIRGFRLQDLTLLGNQQCRNGIVIEAVTSAQNLYGSKLIDVGVTNCAGAGCVLYGNVFEFDIVSMFAADCRIYGLECRNPAAGGGVISSIKVWGGDFRTCGIGIGMTSDIGFQEAAGIQIRGGDFIANQGIGVLGPAGLAGVMGSHFENNCNNTGSAGCEIDFSIIVMDDCTAASNNGKQLYLLEANGGNGSIVRSSYNGGTGNKTMHLTGSGNMIVDIPYFTGGTSGADIVGDGSWGLFVPNYVSLEI